MIDRTKKPLDVEDLENRVAPMLVMAPAPDPVPAPAPEQPPVGTGATPVRAVPGHPFPPKHHTGGVRKMPA